MKTTLTGACVAAFAAVALTASAQQPAPQTPPPQPTPAPSASVKLDKDVTLTGCIKAGTAPGSFELSNIKKGAGSASEPSAAKDAKIMLSAAAGADSRVARWTHRRSDGHVGSGRCGSAPERLGARR